jgi:hypothetical protein
VPLRVVLPRIHDYMLGGADHFAWTGRRRNGAPRPARWHGASTNDALTHNLGGYHGEMVGFVSILGSEPTA